MDLEVEIKGNKIKAPLINKDVWLVLKPEEEFSNVVSEPKTTYYKEK